MFGKAFVHSINFRDSESLALLGQDQSFHYHLNRRLQALAVHLNLLKRVKVGRSSVKDLTSQDR